MLAVINSNDAQQVNSYRLAQQNGQEEKRCFHIYQLQFAHPRTLQVQRILSRVFGQGEYVVIERKVAYPNSTSTRIRLQVGSEWLT